MNDLIGRWNYYFLRYFVGTVVGAVIIMLFLQRHIVDIGVPISEIKFGGSTITMFAALGLAYCYIASAPGTVFHAARAIFIRRNRPMRNLWKSRKLCNWPLLLIRLPLRWLPSRWIVLIPIILSLAILDLLPFYPTSLLGWLSFKNTKILLGGIGLSIFILLLQWVLLVLVFNNFGMVLRFYWNLTNMRSSKANNIQHYTKSYRDLREHGNAFEIIILELVLAVIIFCFKELLPLIVALWVLPAVFCWIIGTMLEFEMPKPTKPKLDTQHF